MQYEDIRYEVRNGAAWNSAGRRAKLLSPTTAAPTDRRPWLPIWARGWFRLRSAAMGVR